MKIRICQICGKQFESCNGRLVCSEECRLERKRQQDRKGNYRRYNGLSNVPVEKICPVCGEKFEALNNVKYCSLSCSETARRKMQKENFQEYYNVPENKKNIIERAKKNHKK